jgi:hypothetical protein
LCVIVVRSVFVDMFVANICPIFDPFRYCG